MRTCVRIIALVLCLTLAHCHGSVQAGELRVTVRRVPGGGVQPQVAVDARRGVVHLVYLSGDPGHSDVEYVRSTDEGATWSSPIRVNSQPGSAIAIGTVRGAHVALGREGRVHVAWMGTNRAEPKGPDGAAPMLYSRLGDDGKSFEPQRNVIASHPGLDGGGSIAADEQGNVYVAWHAPTVPKTGEQNRRVWVARSTDDGRAFAPEVALSDLGTGACGCCGMRLFAAGGKVYALYRGAAEEVNRGMYLIEAGSDLSRPSSRQIAPMKIGICVMSTAAFGPSSGGPLAAWETKDQVFWSQIGLGPVHSLPPADALKSRKHPAIAANPAGDVLLAWGEDTGWNKGGSVGWQVFDAAGQAARGGAGRAADLPAWDSPAVFPSSGGGFVVIY